MRRSDIRLERIGAFGRALNLLDRSNDDITYAYVSRITPTSAAGFTNVFHPTEPFQVRFRLEKTF